jgi:hypothetical protein
MKIIEITERMEKAYRDRLNIMTFDVAPQDCWCKDINKDYPIDTVEQRASAIKKGSGAAVMNEEKGYCYAIAKNVGMIVDYHIGGAEAARKWKKENGSIPINDIEARFYDRVYYDVDGTEIGRQEKTYFASTSRLIFGTFGTKKNIDEVKQYFADLKMRELYGKSMVIGSNVIN